MFILDYVCKNSFIFKFVNINMYGVLDFWYNVDDI